MLPVILLVDDDDAFMMLVERAFGKSGLQATLQYVADGEEAMHYLSRTGEFVDEAMYPMPALVLLDLKMPRVDGFEVLAWKWQQPALRKLPFVVMSSSDMERDQQRAMQLGAKSYLVKPMGLPYLVELVRNLEKYLHERDLSGNED